MQQPEQAEPPAKQQKQGRRNKFKQAGAGPPLGPAQSRPAAEAADQPRRAAGKRKQAAGARPAEAAEVPWPDQGPRSVASGGPADMKGLTAVDTKEGTKKVLTAAKGPAKGTGRAEAKAAAKHKVLQQQQGPALGNGAVAQTGRLQEAAAEEPTGLLRRKGKGKAMPMLQQLGSAPAGGGAAQTSSQPATPGQAAAGVRGKSKAQQHQDLAPASSKSALVSQAVVQEPRKRKAQQPQQGPTPASSQPAAPRQGAGGAADRDAPLGADDMSFLQQLAQAAQRHRGGFEAAERAAAPDAALDALADLGSSGAADPAGENCIHPSCQQQQHCAEEAWCRPARAPAALGTSQPLYWVCLLTWPALNVPVDLDFPGACWEKGEAAAACSAGWKDLSEHLSGGL